MIRGHEQAMHNLGKILATVALIATAACSFNLPGGGVDPDAGPVAQTPDETTLRPRARGLADLLRPRARPGNGAAASSGGTVTSANGQETRLGTTIASLGDPAQGGMWVKTALVTRQGPGRVVWKDNGNAAEVTLIPIEGDPSAGSRISLDAMRALGVPLTALPELLVFAQ